jgi:hypothetical protein
MGTIPRGWPGHWGEQTFRDRSRVAEVRRDCGEIYPMMAELLAPFSKAALLPPLRRICAARGLPQPLRVCRRMKEALVCFFCLFLPDFPLGFPSIG